MSANVAVKYFIFDDHLPGRRRGNNFPEVFGGRFPYQWRDYEDLARWAENARSATEEEVNKLVAELLKKQKPYPDDYWENDPTLIDIGDKGKECMFDYWKHQGAKKEDYPKAGKLWDEYQEWLKKVA